MTRPVRPDATPSDRMLAEMREQPDRLEDAFAETVAKVDELAERLDVVDGVVLLGRGSSRAACSYGAWALHRFAGKPGLVLSPAELAWTEQMLPLERMLVVAVSQSGESRELVRAARVSLDRGAALLVVTNTERSPLTAMVDERTSVLPCSAGPEVAIPATKSVTTAMACLLGLALSGDRDQLARTSVEVPRLLRREPSPDTSGDDLADLDGVILAGEGAGAAVAAEEGAIKFREIVQLPATAIELSELLHGSINSARPGVAVIVIALDDLSARLAQQVVDAAAARGAHTIAIGIVSVPRANRTIALPDVPSAWGAFLALARCQELARSTGVASGVPVDTPPGLTKVTVVRGGKADARPEGAAR